MLIDYGTRRIVDHSPRLRRSASEIEAIKERLYELIEEEAPTTIRRVFYLAETARLVPKTEQGYRQVTRYLAEMRLRGSLPWSWIADNLRAPLKQRTFKSGAHALDFWSSAYRQQLWADQDAYCEIWVEKDAMTGVLYPVTNEFDIPLMVSRGFASLSFLYSAAETIRALGKPAFLYYLGDFDPSGVAIDANIEKRIREFAPDVELHFERIAVTEAQIEELGLPSRPTKVSDSRARKFGKVSVEVDAISSNLVRDIVRSRIEALMDPRKLAIAKMAEESERAGLLALARNARAG